MRSGVTYELQFDVVNNFQRIGRLRECSLVAQTSCTVFFHSLFCLSSQGCAITPSVPSLGLYVYDP